MLLVPGHLNGLELSFIRFLGIVLELRQLRDIAVQIGVTDGKRIGVGMFFRQKDANVFGIVPGQVFRHVDSLISFKVSEFQSFRNAEFPHRWHSSNRSGE